MAYDKKIENITYFDFSTNLLYQNNEPLLKNFKNNSVRMWYECVKERTNIIMRFMIHPVGVYCPGKCVYCVNKDKDRYNKENILTKQTLLDNIVYLFENYPERINRDAFFLTFAGGSPFFHPNIEELLDCAYFIKKEYGISVILSYFLDCLGDDNRLDNIARIISKYNKDFDSKVLFSCDFGSNYRNFDNFNIKERFNYLNNKIANSVQRVILSHYMKDFSVYDFIDGAKEIMKKENYIHKIYDLMTPDLLFDINTMYKDFDIIKNELPTIPNLRERGYFITDDDTFMDYTYATKIKENVWYRIRTELNCGVGNTIGVSQENNFLCIYGNFPVNSMDKCINIPLSMYEREKLLLSNDTCNKCFSKNVCPICFLQRQNMPCETYPTRQSYINMLAKDRYSTFNHFYDLCGEKQ